MTQAANLGALGSNVNSSGAIGTAGIQNDAIVTADIANDAVTTAKIANSAITSAKIGYSGAVLQTVSVIGTTIYTATGSGVITPCAAYEINITPKSASSRFLITLHADVQHSNTPGDGHIYIGRSVGGGGWVNAQSGGSLASATNDNAWAYFYTNFSAAGNNANPVFNGHATWLDSPNTTQTIAYRPYVGNVNVTTGSARVNFGHHERTIFIVQEIQ